MSARKVTYIQLHEPLHSPSIGTIPHTLPSQTKTFNDLEMSMEDGVVTINLLYKGARCSFGVSTFKMVEFAVEPKASSLKVVNE